MADFATNHFREFEFVPLASGSQGLRKPNLRTFGGRRQRSKPIRLVVVVVIRRRRRTINNIANPVERAWRPEPIFESHCAIERRA